MWEKEICTALNENFKTRSNGQCSECYLRLQSSSCEESRLKNEYHRKQDLIKLNVRVINQVTNREVWGYEIMIKFLLSRKKWNFKSRGKTFCKRIYFSPCYQKVNIAHRINPLKLCLEKMGRFTSLNLFWYVFLYIHMFMYIYIPYINIHVHTCIYHAVATQKSSKRGTKYIWTWKWQFF